MTIAYILDTYPSLSETFIAREIAALRRCGFDIKIFALHAGQGAEVIVPSWSQVTLSTWERLTSRGARPQYFRNLGASWWREENRRGRFAGVGHIHAAWASHPAFIAWGAASASGLPWSFSGHARDLWVDGTALDMKLRAARFAAVCTRAGQKHLRDAAPDATAKVLYAPHGIEVESYAFQERGTAERRETALQVLSVGRLVEKKGFAILLEAMALLRNQHLDVAATIIGEGAARRSLEKQIARLGLSGTVHLLGALPHDRVQAAMRAADCFVAPSIVARDGDRDGLPNVLLEAGACGVPLVASREGGVCDFLDETTGRLCAPGDAAALAHAISQVSSDDPTTRALCHAARRRVQEQFDIEYNVGVLAEAFQNGSAQHPQSS